MKKGDKLFKVFLYLVLVLLGVLLGIALAHYNEIPLVQEINLIDFAALIVTIFLAIYVPTVLNRHLEIAKDRKDLLGNRISDYQSLLRRINILVQDDRTKPFDAHLTVKNLLDISEHRLNTLTSLIRNSGLDATMNSDIDQIKELNDEHKNLLWTKADENVEQASSDQSIREQEEVLYNKLDEATSMLIFKLSTVK